MIKIDNNNYILYKTSMDLLKQLKIKFKLNLVIFKQIKHSNDIFESHEPVIQCIWQ